ncbi:MAG: 4Fe-4S dicluster domain-containing protein [Candidatus Lokiarchaeota archaeon]|nr:4Fe-4S dicluster domain-containing protein [Candidatus Lokiarchaeota archaeon]
MHESSDENWNYNFLKELANDVEENKNLLQCIDCGRCVGECPATKISKFNIRKIIRQILRGDRKVLKESDIWYCFLCERCKRVCPRTGINIPILILNLRNESFKKGYGPRYDDLTKYFEMAERFLTSGFVTKDPLGGILTDTRVKELDRICNFARIKYVFDAKYHHPIKLREIFELKKKKDNKNREKNEKK